MDGKPLVIWCNARLRPEAIDKLRGGLAGHRLILSEKIVNNLQPGIPDPSLAEADVAFGQPDAKQVIELAGLRWIQLSSAGYARYDRADLRAALQARGAMLANASSVFTEPCAQHALAFILAAARQIPAAIIEQQHSQAWSASSIRHQSRLLNGQTILIVGFGAIGRRLAELLAPFGVNLLAVRRQPAAGQPAYVYATSELDGLLPQADHVVNILPSSEATQHFFGAERLDRAKHGAVFHNIGRGTTVDQTALRKCLEGGRLGAAYLDVTDPEPLPKGDPLWTAPNCFITPHTAGGSIDEFDRAVQHFLDNLSRFQTGQELRDRVV
jgi:phosphoglycerate dehydrogenase-like enzyme